MRLYPRACRACGAHRAAAGREGRDDLVLHAVIGEQQKAVTTIRPVERSELASFKNRRQILYRDFIEEASKCYIDALQHDEADIPGLVGLYAKLSRMRVLSSKPTG
jgi:hypothetical protein